MNEIGFLSGERYSVYGKQREKCGFSNTVGTVVSTELIKAFVFHVFIGPMRSLEQLTHPSVSILVGLRSADTELQIRACGLPG